MLAVYYGSDRDAVRQAAIAAAREHAVTYVTITPDEVLAGVLGEAAEGASLFGDTLTYVVDLDEGASEASERTRQLAEALASSIHWFVLIEGALTAPKLKPYKQQATVLEEYKAASKERFNTFSLTDALADRDKKGLWLLFTEARLLGLSPEEIIGVLWWQVKAMVLAARTDSATEAGMKDYPYRKAKAALRHYRPHELTTIAHQLITIYHQGHSGETEFDLALEQWMLSL